MRTGTSNNGLAYIACGPTDSKFGLVCIHGWSCQASDYYRLFEELMKEPIDFQAVAPDLPGHGQSPIASCPVATISNFADKILSFVCERTLNNVILVGHSMGCRIVLDACLKAQATGVPKVCGLVHLDGSHYKLRPSYFSFDSGDKRSISMTKEERQHQKSETFRRMFSSNTPLDFQTSTLAHIKAVDQEYSTAIRKSHLAYDQTQLDDAMSQLRKSEIPFLNLQSSDVDAENQRVPLKAGGWTKWMASIKKEVPRSEQHIVEGSAHFPHVDQPAVVARLLLDFVHKVRSSKSSSD